MDAETSAALRELLHTQCVAALATLHRGKPATSMVPYALLPDGQGFIIHVSQLASHTADMLDNPEVSLLVMAPAGSAPTPQALSRVSVQGRAVPIPPSGPDHAQAHDRYLARFPDSAPMFDFGDFSLFRITVESARFVAGFGRAHSVLADAFARLLTGHPS
ncbi:MAG TPA: pyridoxamine 5'-phosphate oxidase family protein [Macromonas sp.]|nr:pyridoxamine 5'-phosphate oxidase family protein [Macromonas sp.]